MAAQAVRFLLVLTRAAAVFSFLPLPGLRAGPDAARLLFSAILAVALTPLAPLPAVPTAGTLVLWEIQELFLGLTVGVALSFLVEATQIAAQMAGLQAGLSFASTIDPTTQADSGVLAMLTQMLSGVLFFSMGLHREIIAIFVRSLRSWPPGAFFVSPSMAESIWRLGSTMMTMGVRLAMPVVSLLLIVDVAFAVISRFNAQLQLLSVAFPAKMLAGIGIFAIALAATPLLYREFAARIVGTLLEMVAR